MTDFHKVLPFLLSKTFSHPAINFIPINIQ